MSIRMFFFVGLLVLSLIFASVSAQDSKLVRYMQIEGVGRVSLIVNWEDLIKTPEWNGRDPLPLEASDAIAIAQNAATSLFPHFADARISRVSLQSTSRYDGERRVVRWFYIVDFNTVERGFPNPEAEFWILVTLDGKAQPSELMPLPPASKDGHSEDAKN